MSKEAMKLALEALERMKRYGNTFGYRSHEQNPYEQVCEAITALEALAEQPAQQEPVAHRDGFWCTDLTCKKCYSADFRFKHKNSVVNESLTTPAQRTWVSLTDKEIGVLWFEANDQDNSMIKHFARAIEAKLRSKNEDRN